jgi:thiamine kinase-like enzyme
MKKLERVKAEVIAQCQAVFPEWENHSITDFEFDDPKGFSSFTMGVRATEVLEPPAVLYRRLEGKENAILPYESEKEVYLTLAEHKIAAHCHYYDSSCRIEEFYQGRTLQADELFDPEILCKIANELFRFHKLKPRGLPQKMFFELLFNQWGQMAKHVLDGNLAQFPLNERRMGKELREIYSPTTFEKVQQCLPDGELTLCHNDTYHGNIMKLDSGEIRLLDFEFSCLNHKVYDFSNLFAETVMRHQEPEYPYFRIEEPEYGDAEIGMLIKYYLANEIFETKEGQEREYQKLLQETKQMLILSDFKYAMAALPLALEPIQKIRFIPYAHQRFTKFLQAF